jgi:hypothetical protein
MKKIIHNVETGEIIEKDFTKAELVQNEIELAEYAERKAQEQAKAEAKAELLDRLGITAEEAQLLLS